MDSSERGHRATRLVRLAFLVTAVTAAATISLVLTGVVTTTPRAYMTFDDADADASAVANATMGGPWILGLVRGLDLSYPVPASHWAATNCTLIAGTLEIAPFGGGFYGFNGNLSSGGLPVWFFVFVNSTETQPGERELLVLVQDGQASMVGEIVQTRWCGTGTGPAISGVRANSDVVAKELLSQAPTQAFLRDHSAVTVAFQLGEYPAPLPSVGLSPVWSIYITDCASTPGGSVGDGAWIEGTFSGVTGNSTGQYGGSSEACSVLAAYPPYW